MEQSMTMLSPAKSDLCSVSSSEAVYRINDCRDDAAADVLVLNGNTIEGHATSGTLAFTITVDPATGRVTFTEYRPVTQPLGTNPDSGEGVSLTAGIVNLTA